MPTPKDTSQITADIQQCWKGTGYHTSFAGRTQRPSRTPLPADSRYFALFCCCSRRTATARGCSAEKNRSGSQRLARSWWAKNEAARERIGWLFCYWHT